MSCMRYASYLRRHVQKCAHQVKFQCRSYSDVSRPCRLFLSTSVTKSFSVPLTLADVYLRDEQLPFAYAFKETLDSNKLITSLKEVLRRYPILGATADFTAGTVPSLECKIDDTVSISFGDSDLTLDEWLAEKRSGKMQHVGWQSGGGPPKLSPLFDDLMSSKWDISTKERCSMMSSSCPIREKNIATVRVIYFKGSGTSVGINISHMLGDANSCFHICQVWGREMRGLIHPSGVSNERADATLTGMICPEMASILNLDGPIPEQPSEFFQYLNFNDMSSYARKLFGLAPIESRLNQEYESKQIEHEYARVELSLELLQAMKSYGMNHCSSKHANDQNHIKFISTNDMITAIGWLIKRHVSQKVDWNLSMVVNLRNRGGIDAFGCLDDSRNGTAVFGNALTSVIARLPPSSTSGIISMSQVCIAAVAVRTALATRVAMVQDLQILSRSGNPVMPTSQESCFSSTSWMQFPLWDISFTDSGETCCLDGFYGRPSYPLPVGDTYSSINVSQRDGGCIFKLLAPKRHVQSILSLHEAISAQFLHWSRVKRE